MDITPPPADAFLENRTFNDIRTGDSASIVRTLSREDIELFAIAAGDVNAAAGAAAAGLAVAPRARRAAPAGTAEVGTRLGLPPLSGHKVVLHSNTADGRAGAALRAAAAAFRSA